MLLSRLLAHELPPQEAVFAAEPEPLADFRARSVHEHAGERSDIGPDERRARLGTQAGCGKRREQEGSPVHESDL